MGPGWIKERQYFLQKAVYRQLKKDWKRKVEYPHIWENYRGHSLKDIARKAQSAWRNNAPELLGQNRDELEYKLKKNCGPPGRPKKFSKLPPKSQLKLRINVDVMVTPDGKLCVSDRHKEYMRKLMSQFFSPQTSTRNTSGSSTKHRTSQVQVTVPHTTQMPMMSTL